MKYKLKKDEFEALSPEAQKEYTLNGDEATLKLEGEGAPSMEAITKAEDKQRIEKEHRIKAEKARDDAEKREEALQEKLKTTSGKAEIEKLQKEHQAELEKIREDRVKEQTAAREVSHAAMIKEAAEKFANEKFTTPSLMTGLFGSRLSVEEIDGTPVIRVKDADGKASALSLDELKKEFLDNAEFSPIIKTDAGSGGGAGPSGGGGGATKKKLSEMTATEEAEFEKANPEGYAAALETL